MNTIAQKFQTQNQQHVEWLAKLFESMKNQSTNVKENQLYRTMKSNPFGVTIKESDYLDIPEVHFVLSMRYAQDVLAGTA